MGIKHLVLGGITVFVGGAIIATAANSAEISEEQEQVICQLKETVEQQNQDGKKLVFVPLLGRVSAGGETRFTAKLNGEINYDIIGACDKNCDELNLSLNNADGEGIAMDKKQDGVPIISFTPPSSNDYQITVTVDECKTENCEFGILLFVPKNAEVITASKVPENLYLFQFCQE